MRHYKTAGTRKTDLIQLRVTPKLAEAIRERAEQDGRPVSEWIRELARREIEKSAAPAGVSPEETEKRLAKFRRYLDEGFIPNPWAPEKSA